jgi:hypothetical protein
LDRWVYTRGTPIRLRSRQSVYGTPMEQWERRLGRRRSRLALCPMWAGLGVDALVSQAQPLDRTSADKMFLHNGCGIFRLDVSIPNCFGINHNGWAVFALVEAAGLIDSHLLSQTSGFGQLLQLRMKFTFAVGRAGWPWSALGASIVADKNMVLKWGQSLLLLLSDYRPRRSRLSTIDSPGRAPSERMSV